MVEKFRGDNWFAEIQSQFHFPYNRALSNWVELIGPVMLGLGTRFWALSLLTLDIVARQTVHAGNGYNVCDNGFKLPSHDADAVTVVRPGQAVDRTLDTPVDHEAG